MAVVVIAIGVSAAFGLLAPPVKRHQRWAGAGCVLLLLAALGMAAATVPLIGHGQWGTAYVLGPASACLLFPAFWLARSAGRPEQADDDDDDGGGGGGGRRRPPGPESPPPAPGPTLDWDAFDDARREWAPERHPASV